MINLVKKTIKYTISAILALVLMYFSFKEVEWSDIAKSLETCNWWLIFLFMSSSIMAFVFRGLRWRELLLPFDHETKRMTTFNAVNIGYIANFVFPRIGEFVRCGFITKNSRNKLTYDKVLGTVALERVWDMISAAIIISVLLIIRWRELGTFFTTEVWEPFAARFNFSFWWIVVAILAIGAIGVVATCYFKNESRFFEKIWNIGKGLAEGFLCGIRMKNKGKFFIYTVVIWFIYWIMIVFVIKAMPEVSHLTMADGFTISMIGSLGWMVPVPGGIGAYHYIVSTAMFALYGISPEASLTFATVAHGGQAITMVLCGGCSYIYEIFKK